MSRRARQFLKPEMSAVGLLAIGVIAMALACPAGAQQAAQGASSPAEQPKGKSFATPENAAASLYAAALRNDEAELLVILGPGAKEIIAWSDDPNERQAQRELFAQKYDQMHRLMKEPDDTVALYVGAENWPLPIPLVEYKGAWYFDTELGKQEIRYRRIGRNEVESLEVCHSLVDAEKEYYAGAHQYTDKFVSSDASHDGLYWKSSDAANKSPIGPYLAHAGVPNSNSDERQPFHGYYYRIVLPQGQAAAAGAGNNAVPATNTNAFMILAFPAEYRSSGVMTFLMDSDGNTYEKDLGQMTASLSGQTTSYNLDQTWKKVE